MSRIEELAEKIISGHSSTGRYYEDRSTHKYACSVAIEMARAVLEECEKMAITDGHGKRWIDLDRARALFAEVEK